MSFSLNKEINDLAHNLCIYLNNKQLNEIQIHAGLLETWNRRMNLTAIQEPEEIARRHFLEGLLAGEWLRQSNAEGSFVDLGSGNGFPAVPMAVVCRQARPLILVEVSEKRAAFLRALVRDLGWSDARIEVRRVKQGSDLVDLRCRLFTSRGVAISELLQEGLPFLEPGGRCVLFGRREELHKDYERIPGLLTLQEEVSLPGRESAILHLLKS